MSNGIVGGTLTVNVTETFLPDEAPFNWFGNMYGYGTPGGIQQSPSEVEKDYTFADFTMEEPLIVDVYAGTPEPTAMALPEWSPGMEEVPAVVVAPEMSPGPPGEVPFNPRNLFGGGYPPDIEQPRMAEPSPRERSYPVNGNEYVSQGIPGVEFPSLRGLAETGLGMLGQYVSQRSQRQPAPRAGLITGDCPPGRVRRRSWGRDICAKKPRMNVCNRSALGRASRRVKGFLTLSKSTEKQMRQSFAPLLRTPGRRSGGKGGACGGCGARTRTACVC